MFGSTEDEDIVAPITHVSVSLDGIPEVVEVHQAPDPYAESPETPEFEQPKKKKGKMLLQSSSCGVESSQWHAYLSWVCGAILAGKSKESSVLCWKYRKCFV